MIAVGEKKSIQELKREKLNFINDNTLRPIFCHKKQASCPASTCIQSKVWTQQSKSVSVALNVKEASAPLSDGTKNLVSRQQEV